MSGVTATPITAPTYAIGYAAAGTAKPSMATLGNHITWGTYTTLSNLLDDSIGFGYRQEGKTIDAGGANGQMTELMLKNGLEKMSVKVGINAPIRTIAFAPWTAGARVEPPTAVAQGSMIDWTDYDDYDICCGRLPDEAALTDGVMLSLADNDITIDTVEDGAKFDPAGANIIGGYWPTKCGWKGFSFDLISMTEDAADLSSFKTVASNEVKEGLTPTYFSCVIELAGYGYLYMPKVVVHSPQNTGSNTAGNTAKRDVTILGYSAVGESPDADVIGGLQIVVGTTGSATPWSFMSCAHVDTLVIDALISSKVLRAIGIEQSGMGFRYIPNAYVHAPKISVGIKKTLELEFDVTVISYSGYAAGYSDTFFQSA